MLLEDSKDLPVLAQVQRLVSHATFGHVLLGVAIAGIVVLVIDYTRMLYLRSKMVSAF